MGAAAASPLMAKAWAQGVPPTGLFTHPKDAIDVMDFEPLARKALPPAHWGYMATGVDDDVSVVTVVCVVSDAAPARISWHGTR